MNKYFGCLEVPNSTVVMPFYDAERDEMNDAVEVVSMAFVSNCKPPSGFAAEQLMATYPDQIMVDAISGSGANVEANLLESWGMCTCGWQGGCQIGIYGIEPAQFETREHLKEKGRDGHIGWVKSLFSHAK